MLAELYNLSRFQLSHLNGENNIHFVGRELEKLIIHLQYLAKHLQNSGSSLLSTFYCRPEEIGDALKNQCVLSLLDGLGQRSGVPSLSFIIYKVMGISKYI